MSAAALIRELAEVGIELSAQGDRLHIVAPRGVVTDDLRHRLTTSKTELLAALTMHKAWHVLVDGKQVCTMFGPPSTHDEALRKARLHWPTCNVKPTGL